jgi:threonine aldolase
MAEFLSQQTWVKNVVAPETNILIFGLNEDMDQEAFISTLAEKGIGISQMGPGKCRMVFHLDVTAADLLEVKSVLAAL